MALWELVSAEPLPDFTVAEVYAGGGPYNLYRTFEGVVRFEAGLCANNPYCDLVDSDATFPFAANRILPGYLAYADTGLTADDVVTGNTWQRAFLDDFVNNAQALDPFKRALLISTMSREVFPQALPARVDTTFDFYHSDFDRLVPAENQRDLFPVLANFTVEDRSAVCNTDAYAAIFALTDFVGISHALCGIAMIDEISATLQ